MFFEMLTSCYFIIFIIILIITYTFLMFQSEMWLVRTEGHVAKGQSGY